MRNIKKNFILYNLDECSDECIIDLDRKPKKTIIFNLCQKKFLRKKKSDSFKLLENLLLKLNCRRASCTFYNNHFIHYKIRK